jgi:hypothetical protein
MVYYKVDISIKRKQNKHTHKLKTNKTVYNAWMVMMTIISIKIIIIIIIIIIYLRANFKAQVQLRCVNRQRKGNKTHKQNKNRAIFIIQFFVYFRSELNSQCPITDPARIQTAAAIKRHRTKQQR